MLKFDYFGNGLINSNEACELSELSEAAAAAAAATTTASDVIALRFAQIDRIHANRIRGVISIRSTEICHYSSRKITIKSI